MSRSIRDQNARQARQRGREYFVAFNAARSSCDLGAHLRMAQHKRDRLRALHDGTFVDGCQRFGNNRKFYASMKVLRRRVERRQLIDPLALVLWEAADVAVKLALKQRLSSRKR